MREGESEELEVQTVNDHKAALSLPTWKLWVGDPLSWFAQHLPSPGMRWPGHLTGDLFQGRCGVRSLSASLRGERMVASAVDAKLLVAKGGGA